MFAHVIVKAFGDDKRYAGGETPLPLVSYSDSFSLGSPKSCTFTLPGRTADTGKGRRPWTEIILPGDGMYSEGYLWDNGGSTYSAGELPKVGDPHTLIHGLVTDVGNGETFTPDGYAFSTTVTAQSYHGVLTRDAVAWWMYYGSVDGWLKARGLLTTDQMAGRIDKILANYTKTVIFHDANWNRGSAGLKDVLGYHFTSLDANAPILLNVALQEGGHWNILGSITDPLHELFSATKPAAIQPVGGFAHRPTVGGQDGPLQRARDGGSTWLIHRPCPFPFGNPDGTGNLGEWRKVRLHDFSKGDTRPATTPRGQATLSRSGNGVKNFFMVYPAIDLINGSLSFSYSISVQNKANIGRYGYSPGRVRTQLILNNHGDKRNMIQLAQDLTWRYAGQNNRMDEMYTGTFTLPFSPQVEAGDRIRLHVPHGDGTSLMEGYVVAGGSNWSPTNGGQTTVQVERLLPVAAYEDPAWFVRGLEIVKIGVQEHMPSAIPKS
jgi:hypothetical protein